MEMKEKGIVVGININNENGFEESMVELKNLCMACDIEVIGDLVQNSKQINKAHYIGSGKLDDLKSLVNSEEVDIVIFNNELSSSQLRNIEKAIECEVIDRTALILSIFAERAKTKEAKLQVEVARLQYLLPRLIGANENLGRQSGGVGTKNKGTGEKKLELDRRKIEAKIVALNRELEELKHQRKTQRNLRRKSSVPQIALVGYTNAGKSTLRNALCEYSPVKSATVKEKVFEADMLFATLDITTRAMALPDNRVATVTDTVGFIRKLPHDLVEAFKSTLEEVVYSDLLLHVVDASSNAAEKQITVVEEVLKELGAGDKPTLLVLNKIDDSNDDILNSLKETFNNYSILEVSAKHKINFDELLSRCTEILPYKLKTFKVLIPYSDSSSVAYLHRNALVESEEYGEEGTILIVQGDDEVYNKSSKYIIE